MSRASGSSPLFGLTVTVGSLLTLSTMVGIVFYVFETAEETTPPEVQALAGGDELALLLRAGEPVPLNGTRLVLDTTDGPVEVGLDRYADQLGSHWGEGETVCVAGAAPTCAGPVRRSMLRSVAVVTSSGTLFSWTNEALDLPKVPAAPSLDDDDEDGTADLAVWFADAPQIIEGADRALRWTARIANNGTGDTSGVFTVRFYLDGQLLSERSVSLVAAGATIQVISAGWQPTVGDHAIRVAVDEPGHIDDLDRSNNALRHPFTVRG